MSLASPTDEFSDLFDLNSLFIRFNEEFFNGELKKCAVTWAKWLINETGLCQYHLQARYCTILLSVPLLRHQTERDTINALLHEMIHAYLFMTNSNNDHDDHGDDFKHHMDRINFSAKTYITTDHSIVKKQRLYKSDSDDLLFHDEFVRSDIWLSETDERVLKMTREQYESYSFISAINLRDAERDERGNIILDENARVDIRRHQAYLEEVNKKVNQPFPRFKKKYFNQHPLEPTIQESDIVNEGPDIDYDEEVIINSALKKKHPKKIKYISKCDLHPQIKDCCQRLNYRKLRPIQQYVIPLILEHDSDACIYARTGSGKTASYLIPLVSKISNECRGRGRGDFRKPTVIIFVYNSILAKHICERAQKLAGTPRTPIIRYATGDGVRYKEIEALKHTGCDMLVATFGRFDDMLRNACLDLDNVDTVVFDEAGRFRPHELNNYYQSIRERTLKTIRTYLFSSVYEKITISAIDEFLPKGYFEIQTGNLNQAEPLVKQTFFDGRGQNTFLEIWEEIKKRCTCKVDAKGGVDIYVPKTIVFVNKKEDTDMLAGMLNCQLQFSDIKAKAVSHHADMNQATGETGMLAFRSKADDRCDIMVTTDRLACGIDFPDVKLVINYGVPKEATDYIQRIGRTGRNGHKGEAITIIMDNVVSSREINTLIDIMVICTEAGHDVPKFVEELIPQDYIKQESPLY